MELFDLKLKKMKGYEEGKIDAIDTATSSKALEYKKNFLKQFIALNPLQIDSRLGDSHYYVTRKYDGEFATIVFEKGQAVTINRSGRVRRGIPAIEEAARILKKAGVTEAIIPAEIYVDDTDKRTRTHDLLTALSKKGDVNTLHLAAFDVLELNYKRYKPENYKETHELLKKWFGESKQVKTVEMEIARSNTEVKDIYRRWVEEGTAEGLVVRSDLPFVFKIKPRHFIDAIVIGFTEGTGDQKGQIRTLLVAMMPEEDKFQVVGHIGGGMKDELKKKMFPLLSKKVVDSDYLETDSNHIAFRMLKPELVLEFSVRDIIYETANGAIENAILYLKDNRYIVENTVTGLSFIAPVFERFREDKKANITDTRLSQIEEFSSFEPEEIVNSPKIEMPKSKLLLRDIYTKKLGDKFMIQKYLIWKTNKEKSGDYPAYVLHYTNYSAQRLELLQREIKISDNKEQIFELYREYLQQNIKKGWVKVEK